MKASTEVVQEGGGAGTGFSGGSDVSEGPGVNRKQLRLALVDSFDPLNGSFDALNDSLDTLNDSLDTLNDSFDPVKDSFDTLTISIELSSIESIASSPSGTIDSSCSRETNVGEDSFNDEIDCKSEDEQEKDDEDEVDEEDVVLITI